MPQALRAVLLGVSLALACVGHARADVADTLARIKPGVVGVGTVHPTRAPRAQLRGTGFVVADGRLIVSCAHVVGKTTDLDSPEKLSVFVGEDRQMTARDARVVAIDRERDLVILRIDGAPLPTLALGDATTAREGWTLYMTGYPLGTALGLNAATTRAGLAAIAPIYTPLDAASKLSPRTIKQARDPYRIFQLDAIAYPGNSGSPVWHPVTGEVYGVVNAAVVKASKEAALTSPTGIAYAIPVSYVQALLKTVRDGGAP
jgi:S1-C subfamily serine protease